MAFGKGCLPAHVVPEKIKKWLTGEEYPFIQLIGETARNELFNYLVTLPSKTKINVVQSSHRKDSLCVSVVLPFFGEQATSKKQKLFSKMRFKLAPVDVTLDFMDDKIVASHMIYYDGLTKDRLFRAISTVEKAYGLLDLVLKKNL